MVAATGLRLLDATRTRTRTNRAAAAFLDFYSPPPPEAVGIVALITAFQSGLATTLTELEPVSRELSEDDEQLLCRYCYVLGLLEELHRAGLKIKSPLFTLSRRATLDDLLALPPQIWVDDLCALSRAFAPTVPEFAREPLVLNPIFAGSGDIGGADADLVSAGCLVDIKTTVDPKFTRTRLLYQLLGYVFLDYDDVYAINSVGVYLSRQALHTLAARVVADDSARCEGRFARGSPRFVPHRRSRREGLGDIIPARVTLRRRRSDRRDRRSRRSRRN